MEEPRYVKVASRFFLVVGDDDGCGDGSSSGCGSAPADRRHHFLDACFLCKRGITSGRHIFMYKGDAAFCSDDCRQDQRDMDAALKALRRSHRMLMRSTSLPADPSSVSASPAAAVVPRRPALVAGGLAAHGPR
ncbi:hypothetical protein BS78_10G016800 [Paspalum vaginatum]|nr:hypothetical protein BS78_10G016800 [Paspalum vaginatum]